MPFYRCLLIDARGTTHSDARIETESLREANEFAHTAGALLDGWGYELWEDEKLIVSTAPGSSRTPPVKRISAVPWLKLIAQTSTHSHCI
jgi:hypothetical protein